MSGSNLNLKFDAFGKNKEVTEPVKEEKPDDIILYQTGSGVRNLSLVATDGKKIFLNYAYLISGEYSPDENTITLIFSSHIIYIRGRVLEKLYEDISAHLPREIKCTDERYVSIKEKTESVVTEINVKRNDGE